MPLPRANFSFTIPSIHDETSLQCRLYHPPRSRDLMAAAVVAHPYAPLGGSYDDPVVHAVGDTLLEAGYVVGTFNFRGASGSGGRTSWSAKPELADYVSFYGFMLCYLSRLESSLRTLPRSPENDLKDIPLAPLQAVEDSTTRPKDPCRPVLILGGYSYGSMIASHLPSVEMVKSLFKAPEPDSAVAEVRLRAVRLSNEYTKARMEQEMQRQIRGRSSRSAHGTTLSPTRSMAMGVFGLESAARRPSNDSRRSIDSVRRSLEHVKEKLHVKRVNSNETVGAEAGNSLPELELVDLQVRYLLVSPLLPPISAFATIFTKLSISEKMKSSSAQVQDMDGGSSEDKLILHRSLAIYGDKDVFTSHKKLRNWAEDLRSKTPGSKFQFQEIEGAGHFWHEDGAERRMRNAVKSWAYEM